MKLKNNFYFKNKNRYSNFNGPSNLFNPHIKWMEFNFNQQ